MDAETIMETARAGNAPSEWNVWPLRRDFVRTSALKWGTMALVGFALLIPVLIIMFPDDVLNGSGFQQSLGVVVILFVGWLAFGSLWIVIDALLRLRRASEYWLVITSDFFIKARPNHLYSIPLEQVGDITIKGVDLAPAVTAAQESANLQALTMARFSGLGNQLGLARTRRVGGQPSLAFRDRRDNRIVVVGTDASFDHLAAIYEILTERAGKKEMQALHAANPLRKYVRE